MSLSLYISYIVVAVIWIFMLVLSIILYFCNKSVDINKVYEDCTDKNGEYQYVVRLVYSHHNDNYDPKHTTITVEIRDSKGKSLSKIAFTPQIIRNSIKDPKRLDKKIARFRLYRSEPLKDITHVDLNHDCENGKIFISEFTIQEVNSEKANKAFVGQQLEALPKHRITNKQQYAAATKEYLNINDECAPSQSLSCIEIIAFLFLTVNIMLLSCVLIIPCSSKSFCSDYRDGLASSAFAGLVASMIAILLFSVTIIIYRYAIKRNYAKRVKNCGWIRLVYIFGLIFIGMICGGLAAFFASNNNKFKQKNSYQPFDHEIYWTLACCIGIIIFMLIWIPIFAVIAYFCGFFGYALKQTSAENDAQTQTPKKASYGSENVTSRTLTDSDPPPVKPKSSKRSEKSRSKSRIKQKSSSTPKRIKRSESSAKPVEQTERMERTPSEESTGENYYQTIVQKHGKVKSVSQYPGIGR